MKKEPIIAICYDFDKTLTPTDMQAQGFIQECQIDVKTFWDKSNKFAKENEMDMNLSWMLSMIRDSKPKLYVTKEKLIKYGNKIELYPGLEDWFDRIETFAKDKGVIVEHYIISSGLKEMIEGTSIASKFKKIYASSFLYDKDGVAEWPAQVVNFTNKTQFIFRIKKGTLEVNDETVNSHYQDGEERVPFRNMIYIGDSDTDVPCMELVRSNGGYSIGVYDPKENEKTKVYSMLRDKRINFFVKADYSESEELEELMKNIICKISYNEKLMNKYYDNRKEYNNYKEANDKDVIIKNDLINELSTSSSFLMTHSIINKLNKLNDFSAEQVLKMCTIALANSQILSIITDYVIKKFYARIIIESGCPQNEIIKKIFNIVSDSK